MTITTTIEIEATQAFIVDADDCLAAAAKDYAFDHPGLSWRDLNPRWADNERDVILLTVPSSDDEDDDGTEDALNTLRAARDASEAAWETAVDTFGPEYDGGSEEKQAEAQSAMDSCLEEYDFAIDLLERLDSDDWKTSALEHLETARSLEAEWGDDSEARTAIEAVKKTKE